MLDPSNPVGTVAALDNSGPQGEFLYPYGKGKIDLVFRFAKWAQSDVNIGKKYKVKDLGGDLEGLVVIPGGVTRIILDDRYLARLNKDGMFDLYETIIHEGLHRTYSIAENLRMGKEHPQIYQEAYERASSTRALVESNIEGVYKN